MEENTEDQIMQEIVDKAKEPIKPEHTEPPKKEVKPQYFENQLIREEWTFDGPIQTRWQEGKEVKIYPKPMSTTASLPNRFKPAHGDALYLMYLLYENLSKQKGRVIPMFQSEALQLIKKKIFRDLESYELVKTRLVSLVDDKGKPIGGRMLCWLTPEGKYLAMLAKKQVEARKETLKAAQEKATQARQQLEQQQLPPPVEQSTQPTQETV
jgi:hypothetical protein